MYKLLFLLVIFSAALRAQPVVDSNSTWPSVSYDGCDDRYIGANTGFQVSGKNWSTVYFSAKQDRLFYCYSTDAGGCMSDFFRVIPGRKAIPD